MSRTVILSRGMLLAIGSCALCIASWAGAQENLEKGKTAAQLYADDCAICHKSPQSVPKATKIFGLESFLREHYTASGDVAAAIAAYLKGLEKPPVTSQRGRAVKRTSQVNPSGPTRSDSKKGELRPPAEIPRPPADLKREKSN